MLDSRAMLTVSDITKNKEMHIWNTVWDTIGIYSMQTRAIGRSGKGRRRR
jgi:hypothetical protein